MLGRRHWVDLAALLALFAAVCGPFLRGVYASAFPSGWDGVPHYAVADLYARKLFPALGGWLDELFAGMPFPNFYPPTFYMLVAATTKLGFSTSVAFWAVQTIAAAAVPCLTYAGARRLAASSDARDDGRVAGLVAGALSIGLLVDRNVLWRLGITLPSTFDAGLSTQLLGHVFLLAFIWMLLEVDSAWRGWPALAAVAFALVPLTNVHMVWTASFVFLPIVAARTAIASGRQARARVLALHGAIGLSAVLLSACWVVPMIARLRYVPTQALEPTPPGAVAFAFLRLGTYGVLATAVAFALRDRRALAFALGLGLLLAFTVLPSARVLAVEDLAIQPTRVVVPFAFLATFLVGYLANAARHISAWRWAAPAAGLAIVGVFFLRFNIATAPEANISSEQAAAYENVLGALASRTDGRVLVEMGTDGIGDPFTLQSLVGMRGARSLTTVFREASIGVFFTVPLRNSFSAAPEAFGVDHKIDGPSLAAGSDEDQLARLRLFNVRYLAVRSDETKAKVASLSGVHRVSPAGRWELWAFDADAPGYAVVPTYAPVLTFAAFSVKPRPDEGVDFVRLGEEMFAAARLDVPLALASDPRLDHAKDWDDFGALLITDYRYDDADRAYETIERASRTKPVLLWPSADPVYARLAKLATVRVVTPPSEAGSTVAERRAYGRAACLRILDLVDAVRVPIEGPAAVASARLDGETASVELDRAPARATAVWIRSEYFPSWTNEDGGQVYMATPTFQLTFTRQRALTLRFRRGWPEWTGGLLSLLGAAAVGLLARRARRPS